MTAPGPPRPRRSGRPLRVLVTGAGGPAAIAAMKSLRADPAVELLAADMDPWAAGLYLVPPGARTLIPAGAAPDFTDVLLARCLALGVDVVLPTVDAELRPLARARETFAAAGLDLLLASAAALEVILDKLTLARHCAGVVRVPRTEPFESRLDPAEWSYPVVVKPRTGSGSRGLMTVRLRRRTGLRPLLAEPDRAGIPARRGVLGGRARRRRRARDRRPSRGCGPGSTPAYPSAAARCTTRRSNGSAGP